MEQIKMIEQHYYFTLYDNSVAWTHVTVYDITLSYVSGVKLTILQLDANP